MTINDKNQSGQKIKTHFQRLLDSGDTRDLARMDPDYLAWLFDFEEHVRAFMENARDYMVYRLERDDTSPTWVKMVFLSPSARDILGLEDPYRAEDWFTILHPEDMERAMKANQEAFATLRFNEQLRIFHQQKDEWRWIHAIGTGSRDETGQPRYANGIIYDITEEKKAEEALREREHRLSLAMEASKAGIFEFTFGDQKFNADARLLAMLDRFGQDQALSGREVMQRIHPDDMDQALKIQEELVKGARPSYDLELRLQSDTGQWVWVHSRAQVVNRGMDNKPEKLIGIVLNVTERKEMEERLRQAGKMEAVGALARGLAHEFNNVLSPIMGFAEMALDEAPRGGQARENMTQILIAARRAKELVERILTLGRENEEPLNPIHLQPVVDEAMGQIRVAVPPSISIGVRVDPSCGRILGDSSQVRQALLHLCTNAYQAMRRSGGHLEVSLGREKFDTPALDHSNQLGRLFIQVRDTGPGMPEEIKERFFDPYFKARDQEEGSGMGLALVHAIVERHKGSIQLESREGEGTTITVFFPLVDEASFGQKTSDKSGLPRGGESLLVVEDDQQVMLMTSRVLEKLGYRVSGFYDGKSAIEAFSREPDRYDLILTDLDMPRMAGDRLAKKAFELKPDIPVVLVTGHTRAMTESQAWDMGLAGYLVKPVPIAHLAKTVRNALDRDKP